MSEPGRDAAMPSGERRHRIARFALVALVACSSNDAPTLARRELPGFSIELPAGGRTDSLDYANGRVEILGGPLSVAVNWEPGGQLPREDLVLFAKGTADATGLTAGAIIQIPGPNNTPIDTATGTASGKRMLISVVVCGGRHIGVVTGGRDSVDEMHGRIVASIACHPDAVREAEIDRPPITIDLPPGWHAMHGLPGITMLTNDTEGILLRAVAGPNDDAALPKTLTALFQAMGAPVTVHERTGDTFPLDGTLEGSKVVGFAMTRSCPPNQVIIVALAETQVRANDLAKLVRERARCLRRGEPAPAWAK